LASFAGGGGGQVPPSSPRSRRRRREVSFREVSLEFPSPDLAAVVVGGSGCGGARCLFREVSLEVADPERGSHRPRHSSSEFCTSGGGLVMEHQHAPGAALARIHDAHATMQGLPNRRRQGVRLRRVGAHGRAGGRGTNRTSWMATACRTRLATCVLDPFC
ncbi:unnamed protein product, partial [Urochloa humidicola]